MLVGRGRNTGQYGGAGYGGCGQGGAVCVLKAGGTLQDGPFPCFVRACARSVARGGGRADKEAERPILGGRTLLGGVEAARFSGG